jgi:hypothetical protein
VVDRFLSKPELREESLLFVFDLSWSGRERREQALATSLSFSSPFRLLAHLRLDKPNFTVHILHVELQLLSVSVEREECEREEREEGTKRVDKPALS